jgi:Asp-tRNA(Asn)/Glu-tRNA(Gln) amidotransferase A subunit family amidase
MQQGSADGRSFLDWLGDGAPVNVAAEVARAVVGRARHTAPALFFAGLEAASNALPIVRGGLEVKAQLVAKLAALLTTERHVLLSVPFPVEAFPHGGAAWLPGAFVYSALWNVLEMPATAVPAGTNGDGLPLGVQVIGRKGADAVCVAVAGVLEQELGGWRPPR